MSLRILDLERDGAGWDAALHSLPLRLHDVYFSAAYHLVWQRNGDGAARGAIFESADGAVLYPFLLRPLASAPALSADPAWRGLFDITSAYGYGGPLAAVAGEAPALVPPATGEQPASVPSVPPATPADSDPAAASVNPARARLLAGFRAEFSAWCRQQRVVSEFIRFHPLLQTEHGLVAAPTETERPTATLASASSESEGPTPAPVAGASERRSPARAPAAAPRESEGPTPTTLAAAPRDPGHPTPVIEVVPANITVWCQLSTPAEHRAALSSSTRRNLRKADRAELTFGVETGDEAWRRFFELYTETMRRREAGEYYLFPPRYFDDCRELLGDSAALLTVRRPAPAGPQNGEAGLSAALGDGEPGDMVAAAFFLRSPCAIHYHLGGSDPAALAERPNNLLFVGAMDWGAELGAQAMHLGGGFRAGGDDELFRFKAGFSPLRARFYLGRCIHDADAYDTGLAAWHAAGGLDAGGYFPAYRAPLPG